MFSTSFNVGTMIETELSVLDIWYVEPTTGFEPVTCGLRNRCSTS